MRYPPGVTGEHVVAAVGTSSGDEGCRRRVFLLACAQAAAAGLVLSPSAVNAQVATAAAPRVFVGPEGAPLPFQNEEEVLEFLRTAPIVSRKTTPDGITRPEKLVLEADGVRAHAILREVDDEKTRIRVAGRYHFRFLDCHAHECAAYRLARRLGLDLVPPTVARQVGTRPGSVQLWIEGDRDETESGFRPRSPMRWMRQQWDMALFDNLILNVDRNVGNTLVDANDQLWLIDHTRAFQPQGELLDAEKLQKVNRVVWDRLQAMSDGELVDVVRESLDTDQLKALVERRALLAERVRALVLERGEDAVFY